MTRSPDPRLVELANLVLEVCEAAEWSERHRPDLKFPTVEQVKLHFRNALRVHGPDLALQLARLSYRRATWPCNVSLPDVAELGAEVGR